MCSERTARTSTRRGHTKTLGKRSLRRRDAWDRGIRHRQSLPSRSWAACTTIIDERPDCPVTYDDVADGEGSQHTRGSTSVGGSSSVARIAHSGTGGRRWRPQTGGGVRVTCWKRTARRHAGGMAGPTRDGDRALAGDRRRGERGPQRVDGPLLVGGDTDPAVVLRAHQQVDAGGALRAEEVVDVRLAISRSRDRPRSRSWSRARRPAPPPPPRDWSATCGSPAQPGGACPAPRPFLSRARGAPRPPGLAAPTAALPA